MQATENQPADSKEEHSEPKFGDIDSYLDVPPGDYPDNSDATCIFCEGIFSANTRGKAGCNVFNAKCGHTQNVWEQKKEYVYMCDYCI